jgi:hypothetical protein
LFIESSLPENLYLFRKKTSWNEYQEKHERRSSNIEKKWKDFW